MMRFIFNMLVFMLAVGSLSGARSGNIPSAIIVAVCVLVLVQSLIRRPA